MWMDYLFVSSPTFAERYFSTGITKNSLLKAPAVGFNHLDDMYQSCVQENFNLYPLVVFLAILLTHMRHLFNWLNKAQPVV